ncbi:MAG: MAPEG family protein [Alphaproteobacteria bacterium]
MTTELWYLFLTAFLLAVLWIPHIIGQVSNIGMLSQEDYKKLRKQEDFPDWVRRANRAHVNLVEQFGAFIGLIVVAHLAGISNGATAFAAALFFWARLAHAVVFIAGISQMMIRTLIFTVAWIALMILAVQILFAGAPGA